MLGLVEPAGRLKLDPRMREALREIPAEATRQSALDRVRADSPRYHQTLSAQYPSALQELAGPDPHYHRRMATVFRQTALEIFLLMNQVAFEYEHLKRKHDGLIQEYLQQQVRQSVANTATAANLTPDMRVDGTYGQTRVMCNALKLPFDDVWNGTIPKWQMMQALQEAYMEKVISVQQFAQYGMLIAEFAKD